MSSSSVASARRDLVERSFRFSVRRDRIVLRYHKRLWYRHRPFEKRTMTVEVTLQVWLPGHWQQQNRSVAQGRHSKNSLSGLFEK